jgi:hypothetical protein
MPRQPECQCVPCQRRRAMNMRWHNKPEVKARRLQSNNECRKEKRAAVKRDNSMKFCRVCGVDITESAKWNRLCVNCEADLHPVRPPNRVEPTDEELDARALASMERFRIST